VVAVVELLLAAVAKMELLTQAEAEAESSHQQQVVLVVLE
jgi:hypothetical protein